MGFDLKKILKFIKKEEEVVDNGLALAWKEMERAKASTKTLFRMFRKPHHFLNKKLAFYRKWHEHPHAHRVHWATLGTYIVLIVSFLFSALYPSGNVHAATYTKTWNTQSDFETSVTNSNLDTSTSAGSIQLAAIASPAITYHGSAPSPATGFTYGMTFDANGDFFLTDTLNNRVVKTDYDGAVYWWLGYDGTTGGAHTTGAGVSGNGNGQFNSPRDVAVDTSGNVYVVDFNNHRVQKFDSSGSFVWWLGYDGSTVGTHTSGAGAQGSAEGRFDNPTGVAIDSSGNIYVVDADNNRIQKFNSSGTFVSAVGSAGSGNGQFNAPRDIDFDASGNYYVTDLNNHRVQKFDSSDAFVWWLGYDGSTIGTHVSGAGVAGAGDGQLSGPYGIDIDGSGNIFVSQINSERFTKFNSSGTFVLKRTNASSSDQVGIAVDSLGNIWVADLWTSAYAHILIWNSAATDVVRVFGPSYGTGSYMLNGDSNGYNGVATDSSGNIYAVDTTNNRVKKFDSSGVFQWWLGYNGSTTGTHTTGAAVSGNAAGRFNEPYGIAIDSSDNIYVTEVANHRVQKFDSSGNFIWWLGYDGSTYGTHVSGTPTLSVENAGLARPYGIALDSSGNIYVTESYFNGAIYRNDYKKFDSSGNFLLKVGSAGSGNGQFGNNYVKGIDVDDSGNVYVADGANHRIQKFDSDGVFQWWLGYDGSTIGTHTSGTGVSGTADGRFNSPVAVAVDSTGNIYAGEDAGARLQVFNSSGSYQYKFGDTGTANSSFDLKSVGGVAVSTDKTKIYIGNFGNNTCRVDILNNAMPYQSAGTLSGTGMQVNAGGSAIWSKIEWTSSSVPAGTTIKFRARGSDDNETWGSWSSYYTDTSAPYSVDLDEDEYQYLEVEIGLTGGLATPVLDSATLTYVVNGPPTVSAVSASQEDSGDDKGKIAVNYTVADADNATDTVTVYYGYSPSITLDGAITSTSPANTESISVDTTDNAPDSGTIMIDIEFINYTSKTATTFAGITRAANNTKAAAHDNASIVYINATTTSGAGSQSSSVAGVEYTGTWNVKTDLPDVLLSDVGFKVFANDGEGANMVGGLAADDIDIDTTNPVAGATPIAINASERTNNRSVNLNLDATDDSGLEVIASESVEFTGGSWESYADPLAFTLSEGDATKTVYVKFRDIYGNLEGSTYSDTIELDTISTTPTGATLFDVSVPGESNYQLMFTWVPISDNDFSLYSIERSVNGIDNYNQIATFTNKAVNAYADKSLSTENTYYYRIRSQDNLSNWSAYTTAVSMQPSGTDQTPPEITGPTPAVTPYDTYATIAWLTNENSDSFIEFGEDTDYGTTQGVVESTASHEVNIVGLTPETTYHFRVRSRDAGGNLVTGDDQTFTTLEDSNDTTPPTISGPNPSVSVTDISAIISWSTNEPADSFVEFGEDTDYGTIQGDVTLATSHSVTVSGLNADTAYHYRVRSRDASGNVMVGSDYSFVTSEDSNDTTPPVISSSEPSVSVTSTTAAISWTTNENSDSFVEYGLSAGYGFTQGKIETVSTHSVSVVGLSAGTTYHYRVRSRDISDNLAASSDYTFTTSLADESGDEAPTISGATAQKPGADPEEVTIIWTTDKYSTSQVLFGTDENNLDRSTMENTTLNLTHYVNITGLRANTKYYYQARSKDASNNVTLGEKKYFITATTSASAPTMSAVEASDITLNSVIISWETDIVTTSVLEYGTTKLYGSRVEDQSLGSTTKHVIRLRDLTSGTQYHFRVSGLSAGGTTVASDNYIFTTQTLPIISGISVKEISSNNATITWSTNVGGDSFVDYAAGGEEILSQGRSEEVTDHAVTLGGLKPATKYTITIKTRDVYGNLATSENQTFQTIIDTTAPVIKDLKSETSIITDSNGESRAQAIISWSTDEPATSLIKYSQGVIAGDSYAFSTDEDKNLTTSHVVIISNLQPSSTYHMKIVSSDSSGNIGVSDDYTVLTLKQDTSLLQYIIQILEERFFWLKGLGLFE